MSINFKKITDLDISDKILFIRTDMNVPLDENLKIRDDTRIKAGLDTIKYALQHNAKIIIATHLGRPAEGRCDKKDSVIEIARHLSNLLGVNIPLIKCIDSPINFSALASNVVMLENVRCNVGEKDNKSELGEKYAKLCDIFVHDAFATAHRAEASTDAIGKFVKEICAGCQMSRELDALSVALLSPCKPVVAIVAGSKVSTKLSILNNLANKVDYLIVGGGILNTFLVASGFNVYKSLYEPMLVPQAQEILQKMELRNAKVLLPKTVVVSDTFSDTAVATVKEVGKLDSEDMILDISEEFANELSQIINKSATVIWNGPMGVFEFEQFSNGTRIVAQSIANSKCFSFAGGGDTIAAINKFNLSNKISYISTAGGALLEFLGGEDLPALRLFAKHI